MNLQCFQITLEMRNFSLIMIRAISLGEKQHLEWDVPLGHTRAMVKGAQTLVFAVERYLRFA